MEAGVLPACFDQFHAMGGELGFDLFENADCDPQVVIAAIRRSVAALDEACLAALGGRRVDVATFLGDWADPTSRGLIQRGHWVSDAGQVFIDPPLTALDGVSLVSGGTASPAPGSGGQFAYAFLCPPYRLQASPGDIQRTFDSVLSVLLPPGEACEITDWSSPHLPEVSPFFEAGMEWWGVYLFTIWQPGSRRLIVIAGSTTD